MLAARQLISITIQDGRILEGRIMGRCSPRSCLVDQLETGRSKGLGAFLSMLQATSRPCLVKP
jgi:hypothetical protein